MDSSSGSSMISSHKVLKVAGVIRVSLGSSTAFSEGVKEGGVQSPFIKDSPII